MQKVLGVKNRIIGIASAILLILSLSSCNAISEQEKIVIDAITAGADDDPLEVFTLERYTYSYFDLYFYTAYNLEKEKDINNVIVLRYNKIEFIVDISNGMDDFKDFTAYYDAYLKSKEEGTVYTYTKGQIKNMFK